MKDHAPTDIAIVGMACRVPGAQDPATLWANVRNRVESIVRYDEAELRAAGVPDELLNNPNYVRAGGPLDGMELFDAAYFGFGPRDAAIMDPQHRHFLECCVEALEDAGLPHERFRGPIGLFAGCGMGAYFAYNVLSRPDLLADVGLFLLRHTGNDKDFLTTRVSYCLDLRGPSVAVQTACSTSLVAVHLACQSLLAMECDLALAGGVTIEQPHRVGYLFKENEILSPDGHCRPFSDGARGTVLTSGLGVVALRRLADALRDGDPIHAVIKATAINNDGAGKVGYLAPSVEGHAAVVAEALALAGIDPRTIELFEAHGTGTQVGDPIEVAAITQAWRAVADGTGWCALGSLKGNIGHLDTAAGVAGLIKVACALKHGELPPSLHFERPNPIIDFANSPFYVNTECRPWPRRGGPRRAAISSLGVGGTNAHAILEEAPPRPASPPREPWQLLLFSGKSARSADGNVDRLGAWLRAHPEADLADVAFTLERGRHAHPHRRACVARDTAHAAALLDPASGTREGRIAASGVATEQPPSVVFMFPGGGAQHPDMGRGLAARYPAYRDALEECLAVLQPMLGEDPRPLLFPAPDAAAAAAERLQDPAIALPLLFSTEYALAQLWRSFGVEPDAMTGHSLGEYAAACLAGVMTLADALALVVLRARLLSSVPTGAILAVPLPAEEVAGLLGNELSLAAINAPELCAVSGPEHAVAALEARLAERDVDARRLKIAVAAHSALLDPILDEFRAGVQRMRLHPPQRRFVSNLTGTWADPEQVTTAEYWVRHLRETVRFADGMNTLMADKHAVFLEVGPGTTLSALARMQRNKAPGHEVAACMRHPQDSADDVQVLLGAVGRLWCAGRGIDHDAVRGPTPRRRLSLPTYAFDRQRYWIEPGSRVLAASTADVSLTRIADLRDWFHRPVWRPSDLPPASAVARGRFVLFLDDDGPGAALAELLAAQGHEVARVVRGPAFQAVGKLRWMVNPAERGDYDALLEALRVAGFAAQHFVHLWLARGDRGGDPAHRLETAEVLGFYSLLSLAQALAQTDPDAAVRLTVVTEGAQRVFREALDHPECATVLGPVQVIPRELAQVRTRWIDVELPAQRWRRRFDARSAAGRACIEQLAAEVVADTPERVVALRALGRFVQDLDTVPVPAAEGPPKVREGGTYVISGGLGGIGLACARWLARQAKVKLALLSRTGLPPRSEWAHGRAGAENDPLARALAGITEIEASGSTVRVLRADVGDPEQVARAVAEARAELGPVRGVIHAAGVIDDALLTQKMPESAARVLLPKVRGTLNLEAAVASDPLDFFVTCSSTSTALGLPGQVDYVAANAFLEAFAASRQGRGVHHVALGWGVWAEVGMAAAAARRTLPADARPSGHPWLGDVVADSAHRTRYATRYGVDLWLLDEHRVKDGRALVPGTGYLEIARAALHKGAANPSIEIRELTLLAPLEADDDAPVEVGIEVSRQDGSFAFQVGAKDGDAGWRECARATLGFVGEEPPAPLDVAAIRARCTQKTIQYEAYAQETKQEAHLDFGPRWKVLRRIDLGDGEGLAVLELGRDYASDVENVLLHPALLDLACHFALPLLPGYEHDDSLYVPLSFGRVRAWRALPPRILSHARLRGRAGEEVVTFDVTLAAEDGTVLADVERFMLRRLRDRAAISVRRQQLRRDPGESADARVPEGDDLLRETLRHGITEAEGGEALARVLAHGLAPAVFVSPVRIAALRERVDRATAPRAADAARFARPELESTYRAPRTVVETRLAALWQEALGIERVGIDDDFFQLGGQSLIAVRLLARVKKVFGVDLPLATLFEAPTVEKLAAVVAAEGGEAVQTTGGAPAVTRRGWTTLVPIQPRGTRPPLYCAAGQGGNAMNLRHLAVHLGEDQPFYGLQARGVDGRLRPHETVEAMAEEYIADVRRFQPNGPYFIGGYSGGGTVAFEMARQLTAAGETVAALILLDSHSPSMPERTRLERMRMHMRRLIEQGPSYAFDKLKERLMHRELWALRRLLVRPLARVFPDRFRSDTMVFSWIDAFTRYEAQPWPGRAHLFRVPIDESRQWTGVKMEDDLGWRHLVGELVVTEVSGDHNSMCEEPHVRVLADAVRACLEEAQAAVDPAGAGRAAQERPAPPPAFAAGSAR
ncbi:MAG TPA: SDR family NAD(P)-dependent oxidoreductase [Planctomycetota bacterium]|nr:SDR family NAD(P)-dependent oxidoreductase [Planctomycetota bacterium]